MNIESQITLAVTAYQESTRGNYGWIKECITPAVDNPMVSEIVVVNDGASDFDELDLALAHLPVAVLQNATRLHVFGNKLESVYQSSSEWVLLCDSDNTMPPEYYTRLQELAPWDPETWYCSSFARPAFDYRKLCGTWTVNNIHQAASIPDSQFWCFVNTGNQFVHRERFLDVFGHLRGKRFDLEQPAYFPMADRTDEKWFLVYGAQDSFFLLKEWLIGGGSVACVNGLEYEHRIGGGDLSNFNRASHEKGLLAPAYFLEVLDAAKGEKHGYHFVRQTTRTEWMFRRDDGTNVIVSGYGWVREL